MRISDISQSILQEIYDLQAQKQHLLIAIDGRAASGKTTLGLSLKESLDCNLVHMDHFFLPPEKRTKERLRQPGGNVDIERFISEVLSPLKQDIPFSYSPYDCRLQEMATPIEIAKKDICIIEGSYSCHPLLYEYYDLKIFLHIDELQQQNRIRERNGEAEANIFKNKWIPLEEAYFDAYKVSEKCDMIFIVKS